MIRIHSHRLSPTHAPTRSRMIVSAALAAKLLAAAGAQAATLVVAQGEVEVVDNGRCSLIEAIDNANADLAVHPDCPTGGGADVIQLAKGSVYTLNFVHNDTDGPNGLPSIVSQITLRGDRSDIARDASKGQALFRILHVAAAGKLALQNVMLRNGGAQKGGAVFNRGNLALTNSTLAANSAFDGGGLFNAGSAAITNSSLAGNLANIQEGGAGGGIYNDGILDVTNSSILFNHASSGGGVFNDSRANLLNSTVALNTAFTEGGGGVVTRFGAFTMNNSTVSGNRARSVGGIWNLSGNVLKMVNSTVVNNTAAVGAGVDTDSFSTLHLVNTIVAGSGAGGDCRMETAASLLTNVHNLIGDGSCAAAFSGDPRLGPLANNGGATQTHALLLDSPAINTGGNCAPVKSRDQRGIARDAQCDIGAFEAEFTPPTAKATAPDITRPLATPQLINVTYRDNAAIDVTSIGEGDIQVEGPNGFSQIATFVRTMASENGTPRVAVVRIAPPGGRWDAADNGLYSIRLNAGAVLDVSGNAPPAGVIGSFAVRITTP